MAEEEDILGYFLGRTPYSAEYLDGNWVLLGY